MAKPLIIALQGFMADGETFAEECRLSEIANGIGGVWVLLDGSRKNWLGGMCGSSFWWRVEVTRWCKFCLDDAFAKYDKVILLGHSDGATMALRLAITLRKQITAVVSYAALYDHWRHHEETPGEAWPPALFLNNENDSLVEWDNAPKIEGRWDESERTALYPQLPGPIHPPATKLQTHLWQPDVANPIVVEWLKEVLYG